MQKIVIKNFGAVKNAEIEIKKILVLIGEQASGKSTIAKLIYYFKSLKDDLFKLVYNHTSPIYADYDFINLIENKFLEFFGPSLYLPDFEIKFYYNVESDKYLMLSFVEKSILKTSYGGDFFNAEFNRSANQIIKFLRQDPDKKNNHEQLVYTQDRIRYSEQLLVLINDLFESNQEDSLFVIAGRNATVEFSDIFGKFLYANVHNSNSSKPLGETLMSQFIDKVDLIKERYKRYGSFEGLIESHTDNNHVTTTKLKDIKNKIDEILKGKYLNNGAGERIEFGSETGNQVFLSNASSGQQESIRILQDIFINVLDNLKVFRILEEPEAHLFPIAQKQMIELLALMINQNNDSQLIITTHSPYVLTVFNNLLFAKRVVEKNSLSETDVSQIISKDHWLCIDDFSAYSLGNVSIDSATNYCMSIINQGTNLIEQNYLDEVSEMLSGDFNALYKIHAKTFARK